MSFFAGKKSDATNADILWFGKDGKEPDWEKDSALACLINGHREFTGHAEDDNSLLLMFNPGEEPVDFLLPPAPDKPWILALTTEEAHPAWFRRKGIVTLDARSTTVLASAPFYRFWR
jgi:pullulanase/glycogen debranching enzyme